MWEFGDLVWREKKEEEEKKIRGVTLGNAIVEKEEEKQGGKNLQNKCYIEIRIATFSPDQIVYIYVVL